MTRHMHILSPFAMLQNLTQRKVLQKQKVLKKHCKHLNFHHLQLITMLCMPLSNICSKMKPLNLEEAGCVVYGELKPVGMLSCLKGIKNLLSVIKAGVTHIERMSMACPIKE